MTSADSTEGTPRTDSAADRFERFHQDNPDVYETLVALAHQWIARTGRSKIGIASLYERTRWEIAIATNDPDFRLDNTLRAYYARLIMAQEPTLRGVFDLRTSAADAWIIERVAP